MSEDTVTPMMAQYLEIKAANPGALLFYRMGDFYEMFFDDALAASEALDIALTRRGKHLGQDIAMCGVPVHAAEGYLLTLIRKGFRVAIAEQLEDPAEARKRGSKSVVRRDVVRLVTPGTLTEESLLDARRHNFLAAYAEVREGASLAWADISTGEFRVMSCPPVRLGPELARLAPREVLLSEARESDLSGLIAESGAAATALARASFDSTAAERRLCILFGVTTLDAFGSFDRADLSAMGALVDYLDLTQRGKLPLLRPPVAEAQGGTMQIDAATRRNLEITTSLSGGREGSLLSAVDRTVTAGGARLLERRLSGPSRDLGVIQGRLDAVRHLVEQSRLRDSLREDLRRVPDIDRALSRLALDRGGPRDLAAIRAGLVGAEVLSGQLITCPPLLRDAGRLLGVQPGKLRLLAGELDWVVSDHACCRHEMKMPPQYGGSHFGKIWVAKSGFGGTDLEGIADGPVRSCAVQLDSTIVLGPLSVSSLAFSTWPGAATTTTPCGNSPPWPPPSSTTAAGRA